MNPIQITLNGTAHHLDAGSTLVDALALLDIAADQPGVAAAVGSEIVRRTDWPTTTLQDGDEVEVVGAAQGG